MRIVAANSVGRRYRRNHCNRKTRPLHLAARSLSPVLSRIRENALGSQEVEQTPRFPNDAARMKPRPTHRRARSLAFPASLQAVTPR